MESVHQSDANNDIGETDRRDDTDNVCDGIYLLNLHLKISEYFYWHKNKIQTLLTFIITFAACTDKNIIDIIRPFQDTVFTIIGHYRCFKMLQATTFKETRRLKTGQTIMLTFVNH